MRRVIGLIVPRLMTRPAYQFSTFRPSMKVTRNQGLWRPICYNFSQEFITMPALSPTMNTGKIIKWSKKVGDKVSAGDLLCEVETDKATVDFETNSQGYLAKIVKQQGESANVGDEVAIIVENQEDIKNIGSAPQKQAKKPQEATKKQEAPKKQEAQVKQPTQQTETVKSQPTQQVQSKQSSSSERVIASPLAKSVAGQKNIDLHGVQGSGPNGRIIEQDVQELASKSAAKVQSKKTQQQPSKKQSKFVAPQNPYEQIPLTGMRKTIAARLLESKTTIPHYYISVDVHMDNIEKVRAEFNAKQAQNGVKVTVNDFILKAAGLALRDFPAVNVQWGQNSIRQYQYSDVSMAVSTESGLITPIIYRADTKGLLQIAKQAKQLAKKGRENKLQPSQFIGGTISVSNAGMYGLTQMVSVINPPQAIILGIAKAEKKILFDENSKDSEKPFKVASVMTVWASVDHRLVDGALAAQYVGRVKKYLQNPINMIL